MSIASSSSIIIAKPGPRLQSLSWNPISRLALSKRKTDEFSFWATKKTLQYTRKSFVVSADTAPEVPPASVPPPPPSNPIKLGPLQEIKDRLETSLQAVENIVEVVEVVADSVDKIAENYAEDLPQGKLRDLVEKVEQMAEKTAEAADALDNVIDKVQDVSEHVDSIAMVTNKVEDLLRTKDN